MQLRAARQDLLGEENLGDTAERPERGARLQLGHRLAQARRRPRDSLRIAESRPRHRRRHRAGIVERQRLCQRRKEARRFRRREPLLRQDQPQLLARPQPLANVALPGGRHEIGGGCVMLAGQELRFGARRERPIVGRIDHLRIGEHVPRQDGGPLVCTAEEGHRREVYARVIGALLLVDAPVGLRRFREGRAACDAGRASARGPSRAALRAPACRSLASG